MKYLVLAIGGFFGMTAVIFGAFGAHALKEVLTPDQLQSYHTGVEYQFYHTFALFIAFRQFDRTRDGILKWAGLFFIAGIILFSGSIYLLATRDILGISDVSWLGPVTPVGGFFFIIGWTLVMTAALRKHFKKKRINAK